MAVGQVDPAPSVSWVTPAQMSLFTADSAQRVVGAGFAATVGFKDMRAPWLLPSTWNVLKRLARDGRYLHQMHHYPNALGERELPSASESPIKPVFVGEFPTAKGTYLDSQSIKDSLQNVPWSDDELGTSEDASGSYLYHRVALIRARGYAGAWLWATPTPDTKINDRRVTWTATEAEQIAKYVSRKAP